MIEIFCLYFLGKQVSDTAQGKGYKGMLFAILLVLLWFGGEFGGGLGGVTIVRTSVEGKLIGHLIGGPAGKVLLTYLCALLGGGLGALLTFLVVRVLPSDAAEERSARRRKSGRGKGRRGADIEEEMSRHAQPPAVISSGLRWTILSTGGLFVSGLVGVLLFLGVVRDPRSGGSGKTSGSGNPQIIQMPDLLAYWSFDAVDGGKVIDHSGHNNHATLFGGKLEPGARGQALWLEDQPAHYLDFSSLPDFNFGEKADFTFAGWFTSSQTSATIISLTSSKAVAGYPQLDFLLREGRLIVMLSDDNDVFAKQGFVWVKQKNDGGWHHFAFTRKGNTLELFIDAVSQGQDTKIAVGGPLTTDQRAVGCERAWAIQNDRRWGNPSFSGGLDEICIFSRALTRAEIQNLMK